MAKISDFAIQVANKTHEARLKAKDILKDGLFSFYEENRDSENDINIEEDAIIRILKNLDEFPVRIIELDYSNMLACLSKKVGQIVVLDDDVELEWDDENCFYAADNRPEEYDEDGDVIEECEYGDCYEPSKEDFLGAEKITELIEHIMKLWEKTYTFESNLEYIMVLKDEE